jgi:hypothetical protein
MLVHIIEKIYHSINNPNLATLLRRQQEHHWIRELETAIKVITKLPNSEQSYKGKVKTHNYINRQNQSTTGKL